MIAKRFLQAALIFIFHAVFLNFAGGQTSIKEEAILQTFLKHPALQHATIAVEVTDLHSAETLISHNTRVTMIPASVQKLLVTATALEVFSPTHTFTTRLEHSGFIDDDGILHGDLFITGGGDPALGSKEFSAHYGNIMESFADAVAALGIKTIKGNVVGDGSLFGEMAIPDTWIWEDIGNYYGATASGLNIYDNTYEITFTTENSAGTPAVITSIHPQIPGLIFDNRVLAAANNRDLAYIYGTYFSDKRIIRGTIPANRQAFTIKGAIPDPAYLAAYQLFEHLQNSGIVINGESLSVFSTDEPQKRTRILDIISPTLAQLVHVINQKSQNLYTEVLLLHLGLTENEASTDAGCSMVKSFWEKKLMPAGGMFLHDGSGLSRSNGMTAGQFSFLLRYMAGQSEHYPVFKASLPVAGGSGNLSGFATGAPHANNLAAKSGSMSRVINYAGYFTTNSGREVAFVVMVNNFDTTPSHMRSMIRDFLTEVASII